MMEQDKKKLTIVTGVLTDEPTEITETSETTEANETNEKIETKP